MIRAPLPVVPAEVLRSPAVAGASESVALAPDTVGDIKDQTIAARGRLRARLLVLCRGGDVEACITLAVYDRLIRSLVLDKEKEFKRMHPRPQVPATSPTRPAPRSRAEGG